MIVLPHSPAEEAALCVSVVSSLRRRSHQTLAPEARNPNVHASPKRSLSMPGSGIC